MSGIRIGDIEPTILNARAVRELAFFDGVAGDLTDLTSWARVNAPNLVYRQREELRGTNYTYRGAYIGGTLLGYVQTGSWHMNDEENFAVESELPVLEELKAQGVVDAPKMKLGIFGLAISRKLDNDTSEEMLHYLLDSADAIAQHARKSAVNVSFNEATPASYVAMKEHDYVFTGRVHQPSTRSDTVLRLYSKPIDRSQ